MLDIEAQVGFWIQGAREDWGVAQELLAGKRIRHALFFAHLALEKTLKALVCRCTGDLAPRRHNLVRLAELAEIQLNPAQRDVLAEMNSFGLAGRYPESSSPLPSLPEAKEIAERAEGLLKWLMQQL